MPSRTATPPILVALCLLLAANASAVMTETKLIDANGGANDYLGWSVAMDGVYAIAGAPIDASMGSEAGKAVIFFFDGANWVPQAELFPTSNPGDGRFGWSVDIAGDVAVVGAPYVVASGASTGLAYVYRRSGASWTLDALLAPGDGAIDDRFGVDVAVHGGTVAVGAPGHSSLANDDGAVYVYIPGAGGGWTLEQKLDGPVGADTSFGSNLDVWGDWIAASSSGYATTGFVHTYVRGSTQWIAHQFFDGSDSVPFDGFGRAVEIYDERLVVGAQAHHHGLSEGAGYLIDRDALAGSWPQKAEFLENSSAGVLANLGWSAGLEADLAAVGALYGDGIVADSGLVYAYRRGSNDKWYEVAALTASDGFASQSFASSAGVSGDCIIVGASADDDQGTFAGAAYIYCGVPDLIMQIDIDIICCVQIPDYTTGPVEFEIRFENVSMAPITLTRRVELIRPDGGIVEVVRSAEIEVLEGETYQETFETMILASDPPGDYGLVVYWQEGESTHTEAAYLQVVEASLPGLPLPGALTLASGLLASGLLALRRRAHRIPNLRGTTS